MKKTMFLKVEYSYRTFDSFVEEESVVYDFVIIEAPETLKRSKFYSYVIDNYLHEIKMFIEDNEYRSILNFEIDRISYAPTFFMEKK